MSIGKVLMATTGYSKIITENYDQLYGHKVIITAFLMIFYSETMETILVTGITKAGTICMYVCACACSAK